MFIPVTLLLAVQLVAIKTPVLYTNSERNVFREIKQIFLLTYHRNGSRSEKLSHSFRIRVLCSFTWKFLCMISLALLARGSQWCAFAKNSVPMQFYLVKCCIMYSAQPSRRGIILKQEPEEYLPVGCVPPACWLYPSMKCAGGCLPGGRVSAHRGCLPRGCLVDTLCASWMTDRCKTITLEGSSWKQEVKMAQSVRIHGRTVLPIADRETQ